MKTSSWLLLAAVFLLPALALPASDNGSLSPEQIGRFQEQLGQQPDIERTINAVTNNDIKSLSLNRELLMKHNSDFNMKVTGSKIIDQKSTGRCWMFAGSNVVTPKVMTKLELSDFVLSKSYLAFWDKLEKSNHFLEKMIEYRDRPLDDRSLLTWLETPVGDGGWWQYFEGLIGKYGIVPASAMPETHQSSKTTRLNSLLNTLLKKATAEIRRRAENGRSVAQLREYKQVVLADVYRLLVFNYGQPPDEFVFRWEKKVDDSTKTLTEKTYTPMSFYNEFYGEAMPQYMAITNNPGKEYGQTYLFKDGRNMMEEDDILVLNLPLDKLKEYTFKMLTDSQIVWFACDVGPDNFNDSGIFAVDIYDYNATFGIDFHMPKADRVMYEDISPNHAMVITGVDTTAEGTARKWLVENSWGTDKGKSGYWTMYDDWYDQNVLLVMVDKKVLEPDDLALFEKKPVVIEDWEPFFTALRNLQ
jgi:bleomycin hydrolase